MLVGLEKSTVLLSPELTRSSLWVFVSLMTFLTPLTADSGESPAIYLNNSLLLDKETGPFSPEEQNLLPKISPSWPVYARIFELAMDKVVAILTKMSGEKKLKSLFYSFLKCNDFKALRRCHQCGDQRGRRPGGADR
jgi:hypothetical protein